jgi:hypothetical protein
MANNVIYVDPEATTSQVISVNGACYTQVGPSSTSPNTFAGDISAEFTTCATCAAACEVRTCPDGALSGLWIPTWQIPPFPAFLRRAADGVVYYFGNPLILVVQATGGTFKFLLRNSPTGSITDSSAIAFNASTAVVLSAISAMSIVGSGNVSVTGPDGGPWIVTFSDSIHVSKAGTDSTSLTGPGSTSFVEVYDQGTAGGNFGSFTVVNSCSG